MISHLVEVILYAFIPAYLVGSIPFGYLMGSFNGIDIREHGSSNIGATNVWRVLGKKWGMATFVLDFLKVPGAALVIGYIQPAILLSTLGAIFVLVGAVVGHNYPICLKFKGGKGIATSAGGLLWLLPIPFLVIVVVWVVVFGISRYVSLASIVSAAILPFVVLFIKYGEWKLFWFCSGLSLLAIWRHRTNIQRLKEGTELGWKKKGTS
jgi:glycerol-3-phosphate acyltransferase PlsY